MRNPKIRFKGYADTWEQRKFSELYEKSSEKNDGSIDVERNITVATMQFKPDVTVSSEDYLKTYYTFNVGDIAFEGHHSKDFMFGRFVENDIGDGIVSHIFAVFRPIVDYDLYYWKYAIHNESIMRPILSKSTKASTMMHDLVTKDFLNESILVPSVDEQKRIGAYLNNLDFLITLHQRKCEEIKTLKKFMLQKMFPQNGENVPEIRFDGFTNAWEQRKLGATNTFFTDGNYGEAYPKSSDMTDSGSGIPFLTGGNLKDGKLSLDGASYITPEKHSKLTSGHLLEDDIVIAVRGSLGALGYVNTDNSGWNINSQLAILRTDKSELYGKFLIQYLLSWTGQNELLKRQTGSALKQLPIGAIKDVEVPITSIAEQGKIGEYFADLDNLITLHQRKCDELQSIKKFMLQNMFV